MNSQNGAPPGDTPGPAATSAESPPYSVAETSSAREFPRVAARRRVLLAAGRPNEQRAITYTIDLSGNGVLVEAEPTLTVGAPVWFVIDLITGRAPVAALGRVVRHTTEGSVALSIERIAPGDQELLVRFSSGMRIVPGADHDERRAYPRVWSVRSALVHGGPHEANPIATRTLSMSGGGFLLAGPKHLEIGEEPWVLVDLDENTPPVAARTCVVRQNSLADKGVQIHGIAPADRERLITFCGDVARPGRRRTAVA